MTLNLPRCLAPTLAVLAGALGAQKQVPLEVGGKAPQLRDLVWLLGEPVALAVDGKDGDKKDDKIVVVEFWGTCCTVSRMVIPTLSELQRCYPDSLRIVGIAQPTFDARRKDVESFVQEWKGRIAYSIAWDEKGRATADWYEAAGMQSYPVAFVVDGKHRIAWIGPPHDGLADVVERLHAGTFDLVTARQIAQFEKALRKAMAYDNREMSLAVTARWIALEPARAKPWITRFLVLASDLTAADATLECAREALAALASAPAELAQFANEGLFAATAATDCHALGLQAVRAAFAKAGDDPQLAVAYFSALAATKQDAEADKVADKALELAAKDATMLVRLAEHFGHRGCGKRFATRALAALHRASELEPANHHIDRMEFDILAGLGEDKKATAVGERIVEKAQRDEAMLNEFAWNLLDKPALRGRFDVLALTAAEAVSKRPSGGNWMYVDTLALAKFVNGYVDEAVKLQRRAVKDCTMEQYRKDVLDRLKMYEKAAETRK